MLDNPWNAPIRPNADDPSPRVVSLHRGPLAHISATRVARATRDPGMLAALAERAEEAAYDDFDRGDGYNRLGRRIVRPAPPELLEQVRREDAAFNLNRACRLCDWLARAAAHDGFWLLLGAIAAGVLLVVAFYAGWTA